jgi:cytosine/adenosine deaminase-related metal-dependent hydrolase
MTLIRGAQAVMTGLAGKEARAGNAEIRIRDGRIAAVGRLAPEPGEKIIDATDCVVYPAWVNTHHHLFQTVMKGVPGGLDMALRDWLVNVPSRYRGGVDEEVLRVSARLGMVELMLSGCATIADHHYHYYPGIAFDGAAVLFEEAARLGVRFVLCRGGMTLKAPGYEVDTPPWMMPEKVDDIIDDVERLAKRYHDPDDHAFRRVVMAPTTPTYRVRPEELLQLARAARRLGLRMHSHLSENIDYLVFCREKFGMRPVEHCAEHEWLGPDVWFAHLCHVSDGEIEMMGRAGTGIAHCPGANCRLGSGIAPAPRMKAAGMPVSLGVDGAAANEPGDLLTEAHLAWYVHRAHKGASGTVDGGADAVTVEDIIHWGTAGGGQVLGLKTGVLAPGYAADIAIYELSAPRYFGLHDPAIAPVASGGRPRLRQLICGGRTIVENDRIPGLDLGELAAQAREAVGKLRLH